MPLVKYLKYKLLYLVNFLIFTCVAEKAGSDRTAADLDNERLLQTN